MAASNVQDEAGLGGLIDEYRVVMTGIGGAEDWDEVEARLESQCDWTAEGSAHVAALARRYGAFVLRNALALAIALDVEDGDLGL